MKNLLLLLMAICLLGASSVKAQEAMDKAVVKAWKKKLKSTDPMEFKRILEEREALSGDLVKLKQENLSQSANLLARETEIAALKDEIEKLKVQPKVDPTPSIQSETQAKAIVDVPKNMASGEGITYKVQIGSFRNKDLVKFFKNSPNFSGDIDEDGIKKYTLGQFTDYWEADNFKKYLREMGVTDAWVVSYKNGKRVNIKDALEGAL